jgi:hypothetical protein
MTRAEFIRVLSRAFAVYFLVCALADFTFLPRYLNSLVHHFNLRSGGSESAYWCRYCVIDTASLILRIAGFLLGVACFWNPSPRIERILSPAEKTEPPADSAES